MYLGVQEPLGREVAIKVLRDDLSKKAEEEFEARFLREAGAAASLRHPNVVVVYDYGHEGALRYVVMERLKGERLTDHIERGPSTELVTAEIAAGVARGLRHAHKAGLVHRDIKPGNIMLELEDEKVRPVLVDFGLVKHTEEEHDSALTAVGTYMGTPAYMAPEQSRGEPDIDGRVDIYALGCVMFKMLTGHAPYRARNALALAMAHANEPIPHLADRGPLESYDEGFESILRKCLQKDPADRWADAGKLANALETWARGDTLPPVLVSSHSTVAPRSSTPPNRPAGTVEVQPVPSKKRRVLLPFLALGGVGLIAAVGVMFASVGLWWSLPVEPVADEPEVAVEPAPDIPANEEPAPPEEVAALEPAEDPSTEPDVPPEPTVDDAPQAAVAPVPEVRPAPVVAPKPKPKPKAVAKDAVVDGVFFSGAHAARAVAFLNSATEDQLRTAGVYGRGVGVILNARPFTDIASFGATPQVGEKTVQAVHRATEK